jgi:uncharacterized protein YuzE
LLLLEILIRCATQNEAGKLTHSTCIWTISGLLSRKEVAPDVILDYNEKNEVVGVEMFYLSKRTPNLKTTALEFESV